MTICDTPEHREWLIAGELANDKTLSRCVRDDRLSWVGWPEGSANLADCELVRKASPESRRKLLEEMAAMWRLESEAENGN